MTTTLPTVLISGASEELTSRIEHLVRGQAELSLIKTVTPEESVNATFKAKLIWIELESDPEGNVALLDHLIKSHPNTFFVVSKEDLEPDLVKRTMQIGALDFLDHKGWAAQIRSVVRRIMAKEFGSKPSSGSPMPGAARQPQRPSSWGSLNSLKVTVPPNTGFRRVEPGKAMAAAQPTPAPPAAPHSAAPPVAPEPAYAEVQEQPYEEAEQVPYAEGEAGYAEAEGQIPAGGYEAEVGYAEGEVGYAEGEGEVPAGDFEAEVGYAEGEGQVPAGNYEAEGGYAEGQGGYAEDELPAGDFEAEGGYAEAETGYAEGGVELPAGDFEPESGYAEAEAGYAGYAEGEAELPAGDFEPEGGYAEAEAGYAEGEIPAGDAEVEYEQTAEGQYTNPAAEQTYVEGSEIAGYAAEDPAVDGASGEEVSAEQQDSNQPPPAKGTGGWDDLDSIISTGKPDEKKAPSKWGELGNIQTSKAKDNASPAPLKSSKWSDLDAIGAKPSATPDAPAAKAGNKWSDLDAIAGKSAAATSNAGKKWGDLDALSSKSSEPATPSANKWSDLDTIGAKPANPEPTTPSSVGNKWGDLDAISGGGAKSFEPEQPSVGGASAKKWGELDALGGKTSAPKTNAKSFIKPKSDVPAASAKSKWGDLAAPDAGSGTPESTPQGGKWGNLDTLGGGIAKSQPMDVPATMDGGIERKWGGDLNSIPTPRSNQDPSGNWGDLLAIPTPATPEAPVLIEGALPSKQITNDASQKWKAGMSSDISTGARQVGEMRDSLKEKAKSVTKVKVGWQGINIAVAVAIVASAGFLSYQFFTYPTPPPEVTNK